MRKLMHGYEEQCPGVGDGLQDAVNRVKGETGEWR